jgi:hypothetical protein
VPEDLPKRRITEHEQERVRRLTADRGRYKACRHYKPTETGMRCDKHGIKHNCIGCFTCPNCGGLMFTYRVKKDRQRDRIYITHAKSCAICGAYIEEEMVEFTRKGKQPKAENKCQVSGCENTVWDGYQIEEQGHKFSICETHKNRLRTWKHNINKGEQHKPVIIHNGKLIENPNYHVKQQKVK